MKVRKKKRISLLMKILIVIECVAVFFLVVLSVFKDHIPQVSNLFQEEKVDVMLDAGHGGYDTGCTSQNFLEKDITLAITQEIGKQLEANGYKVSYIRENDEVDWANSESEDLKYRVNTANASKAKLLVSIHVNSEEVDHGAYGYEAWGKLKKDGVFDLAKNMLDSVGNLGYSQNRGMKDQDLAPLYLLNKASMPAVLFEVGFINSNIDRAHLQDGMKQKSFSDKLAEGIIKTLKDIKKNEENKEKENA